MSISEVLVEGLASPLGVATLLPRFSWQLSAPAPLRNVSQVAYEFNVTASGNIDESGSGGGGGGGGGGGVNDGATPAIWSTGLVASSQSTLVPPPASAQPLLAGQVYWLSVRVWTVDSLNATPTPTAPSAPSRFSVGLQSRADFAQGAAFIALASPPPAAECPWLRSTFSLSLADVLALRAGAGSALLTVASAGFHEAFVNGQRLEPDAVLLPSVSDLGRRVLSHTYDAAPLLVEGVNAVGLWIAPGWGMLAAGRIGNFNLTGRFPAVLAELRIQGSAQPGPPQCRPPCLSISTNASWRVARSSTTHTGLWQNSDFGGDNLTLSNDIPGWATAPIDDSQPPWQGAAEVALDDRAVTPESLEPTGVIGTVAAASVAPCASPAAPPGCFLVTMAELFSGWLRLSALRPLALGAPINISYSTSDGVEVEFNQRDVVSPTSADGSQAFCGRFSYHEIKYATLTSRPLP